MFQIQNIPYHFNAFLTVRHQNCCDEVVRIMSLLLEPEQTFVTVSTTATAAAKSLQSCPTLCDPIDGSPRGSSAPGILQARTLEWVAIAFSNA